MSGEGQTGNHEGGNKTLEERLKALEEQNSQLASKNDRLEKESRKFKEQARTYESKQQEEVEAKKKLEEEKLRSQGEFKALLEQRERELEEARRKAQQAEEEANNTRQTLTEAQKLAAFQNRLGGTLKNPAYLQFVDTSKIVFNPETNQIDTSSVDMAVKSFLEHHSALVEKPKGGMYYGQGGRGGSNAMSHDKWSSLGTLKEKRENFEAAFKAAQNK